MSNLPSTKSESFILVGQFYFGVETTSGLTGAGDKVSTGDRHQIWCEISSGEWELRSMAHLQKFASQKSLNSNDRKYSRCIIGGR